MNDKLEEAKLRIKKFLIINQELCPLLFDEKHQHYQYARECLLNIGKYHFPKIQKVLPDLEFEDVVLIGSMAGYLYNETSGIDIAVVVKMDEDKISSSQLSQLLGKINPGHSPAYFNFSILKRHVNYGCYNQLHQGCASYSFFKDHWIYKPHYQGFSFSLEDFCEQFFQYSGQVHQYVAGLEKYNEAFLTMDSCTRLEQYLDNLEFEAIKAKIASPEREYCMSYMLFRCLKKFGVLQHFRDYVSDSHNYDVNVLGQNK